MPIVERGPDGKRTLVKADAMNYDAPADPYIYLSIGRDVIHLSIKEALEVRDEINAAIAKVLGVKT